MYAGSLVAMITPFRDGKVDEAKLRDLVEWQIANGTDGLVPVGTTGEAVTLDSDEYRRVISIVAETAARRVPVVAGTGTNDTAKVLQHNREAKAAGADALLIVTPYYNRPTQEGLFRHYEHVAARTDLPIVMYNVPSRTGTNMLPETVARLAKLDNIVAIKEASGNMDQVSAIVGSCPPEFAVLSGDDSLTLPIMSLGGKGIISVVANIAPQPVAQMAHAFLDGDLAGARALHYRLFDLCRAMFIETNPIPVKTAARMMELCSDEMRLPLYAMSEANAAKLRQALLAFGLLKG